MQVPISISEQEVFHCPYFQINCEKRQLNSQVLPDFYHLMLPAAVMVLACSFDKILVCREWRAPVHDWVIGLPGGRVDSTHENLPVAAQRELLEETGFEAKNWREVAQFHPFVGMSAQTVHVWQATQCYQSRQASSELGEFIECMWLTKEQLVNLLRQGQRLDGILASCLWLLENLG